MVAHEEGVGFFGRDWLREALLHSEGLVACGKRGHGGHALDYLHDALVRLHAVIAFVFKLRKRWAANSRRREQRGRVAQDFETWVNNFTNHFITVVVTVTVMILL